jgi:hypothetical protein
MGRSLTAGVLVALAGAFGACGGPASHGSADAGGAEAAPESPSVSAVVPTRVFLARTTEVSLSGYATHWSNATTVDFGPGITVESLVAASPTALVARVVTTKSTPLGTRDVVVDDGSSRQRFVGAFEVASPLTATFQGTMAQGALGRITLQVLDSSTPLDSTSETDLDGTVTYPNIALGMPAGVGSIGIISVSDFEMTFGVSIDVDASATAGDIDVVSGPPGGTTTEFPLPSGMHVTARTAAPLVSGVAATGQTSAAYDSVLYAFTPGAMAILDFYVTSSVDALDPAVALLPSSGHFADLLGYGYLQTAVAPGGLPMYAVYWENTGGTGPYSISTTSTKVAASLAATPADETWQGALTVSALPFVLTGGDHANPYGADWVKLDVSGPTALRVQTTGDPETDTRVTAYESNASTVAGTPVDTGYAADGTILLPAAGAYYVEFSQGMYYAAPHTKYTGIIRTN